VVNVVGEELKGSEPLCIYLVGVEKDVPNMVSPKWVVERVKDYLHVVGLSCDGFDKMLALFAEIKANKGKNFVGNVSEVHCKPRIKVDLELKRLDCSVNYDKKGWQSNRQRKGEGLKLCIMKPKIVAWNVRGLNAIDKRPTIRGLLRDWKADVVCLLETKLESISREVVRS